MRTAATRSGLYAVLGLGLVIAASPLLWALSSAFKPVAEIFDYPPSIVPESPTLTSFERLFTEFDFWRWFGTSLAVAVVTTVAAVFLSAMGGYAFAKFRFPGQKLLFDVMFSSMMIPFGVLLVPLFVEITRFGLADTYLALIVPWVAPAFGIFMMRQFVLQSVPDEVIEAARIDGCSEFGAFLRIALPLLRPALGALGVWTFLNSYNSFLWPLVVLTSQDKFTLPLGLNSLISGYEREYGLVMAAAVLAAVPTIAAFLVLRRQLIEGLTVGSVKG
jgi:multiple sugar transport system permease protein